LHAQDEQSPLLEQASPDPNEPGVQEGPVVPPLELELVVPQLQSATGLRSATQRASGPENPEPRHGSS
jgi:hypothetical protein